MIKNSILFIYLLRIMIACKHINVNPLVQNHKSVKTKTNKKIQKAFSKHTSSYYVQN